MRLLTHNQLVCVRKGCAQHYPLLLAATKVERVSDSAAAAGSSAAAAAAGSDAEEMEEAEEEEEEDPEEAAAKLAFVLHVLPTLDYTVLRTAAAALGVTDLPEKLPELHSNEQKQAQAPLLKKLHEVLVELHVQEGALRCENCGRSYPIQQGIPNMRLNEDEVA